MRILWVGHSGGTQGAERTMLDGLAGLAERGLELHAVLPSDRPADPAWGALGIDISFIDLRWWMSPGQWRAREPLSWLRRAPTAVACLRRIITDFRPDLIVTNSIVIPQGAIAAALTSTPHAWFVQEDPYANCATYLFGGAFSRAFVRSSSARVLVPSETLAHVLARFANRDRIDRIRLAVDTPRGDRTSNSGSVLMLARMTHQKRQADLIHAVAALKAKGRMVNVDFVGDDSGPAAASIKSLAVDLGVETQLRFWGPKGDPGPWLASAVALVVASSESFGRVTVEAMKKGTPVIGADCGGTAELIVDGKTGWLYPLGDIAALSDRIAWVVENRREAVTVGDAAHDEMAARFTRDAFLDDLVSSFERAIA